MKTNTKTKLILVCLVALISFSFVFGSNVANYPVKLSEDPLNTSDLNGEEPSTSTNGGFKIYWEANGTALTDSQNIDYFSYDIISDGEGGAIISYRDSNDIYAQKINSSGALPWGTHGRVICNASNIQRSPKICSVEGGGAIITWEDERIASNQDDIYAQYIDSNGTTYWGESFWSGSNDRNGTVICNASSNQKTPQICSVEAGGAIITWEDERIASDQDDIYAQYIDSNGITYWGESFWSGSNDCNGTVICNASNIQRSPKICSVEAGGAIITWEDERIASDQDDIYAQNISVDGTTHWGDGRSWGGMDDRNGTVICNATGEQFEPQICSDEVGGAIIAWLDKRFATTQNNIYVQHVSSDGTTHWGDGRSWGGMDDLNGTVVCNATNESHVPYICSDGAGGAFISWEDDRDGDNWWDVYAQYVSSDGITHWSDGSSWGGIQDLNGTVVSNGYYDEYTPQICRAEAGGLIIPWSDYRSVPLFDIYVQYVNSEGTPQWGDGSTWNGNPDRNGTAICNNQGDDAFFQYEDTRGTYICSDNNGGAIMAWTDHRGSGISLYAQRVGLKSAAAGGGGLPAGDDDDDDDEDTGVVVVVVVIIILSCVGGVVVVVIVLIKKGIISTSKLNRG